MKIISHRGLLYGPNKLLENLPNKIDETLYLGFDVEVDVLVLDNKIFLGHDGPNVQVDIGWFLQRKSCLWVHCKNIDSLLLFSNYNINYFWHESDTVTLTSFGYIWAYPGKQPIPGSIAVLTEINSDPIDVCIGVCTDYPLFFREKNEL